MLLASAQASDRSDLAAVLRGTRFVVVQAGNLRDAATILSHIVFPIILYDTSFDVADWRLGSKRIISSWRVPSLLLIANRYDAEFTGDSIRRGAFDILVRPLSAEWVISALGIAYIDWKLGMSRTSRPATRHDRTPLD